MFNIGDIVDIVANCGMKRDCPLVGKSGQVTALEAPTLVEVSVKGSSDCDGKVGTCWFPIASLKLHETVTPATYAKAVASSLAKPPTPSVAFSVANLQPSTLSRLEVFKKAYPDCGENAPESVTKRIPDMVGKHPYKGSEIFNGVVTALLAGMNVLLEGAKGGGKNTLAETAAWVMGRPVIESPLNIYADEEKLVGTMTLKKGEVTFQPGPVTQAMKYGGVLVLDEMNMARPEAIAILNGILDGRRRIDIPGVGRVTAHPAFRVIGTMNYGYVGTSELNEALADRFVIFHVEPLGPDDTVRFLTELFPKFQYTWLEQAALLHRDLEEKAANGEISSRGVSFRGILDGLRLIEHDINPHDAFTTTLTHKAFEPSERRIISDTIATRFHTGLQAHSVKGVA